MCVVASLFLKNIAFKYWSKRFPTDAFEFHAEDKAVMRQHILNTIVHSPDLVRCVPTPIHVLVRFYISLVSHSNRAQLGLVIRCMIDEEFPAAWPMFSTELTHFLQSPEYHHVYGALVAFYEIAKKFQFVRHWQYYCCGTTCLVG